MRFSLPGQARFIIAFLLVSAVFAGLLHVAQAQNAPSPTANAQSSSPDAASQQPQQPSESQQAPSNDQGGFVFKKEVQEVILHATVVDEHNHLITNLGQNAFSVFEDGTPQAIT